MIHPTIHNTYGALVIGICGSIFLFGVITFQTFEYFTRFSNDKLSFKLMVIFIWVFELGHTMAIASELYEAVLPAASKNRHTGIAVALLFGGLSCLIVQVFFARRIWKLLPRPYHVIGPVCFLLALVHGLGTTVLSVEAIKSGNLILFRIQWAWLITSLLALSAGTHVIIAASMVSFLLFQKNNRFGRYGRIVDRLVAYTTRTGLFTSITAVTTLICFQTMPQTLIWIGIYCILAKVYANSLLTTLMERQILRDVVGETPSSQASGHGRLTGVSSQRLGATQTSAGNVVSSFSLRQRPAEPIVIEMKTTSIRTPSEKAVTPSQNNYPGFEPRKQAMSDPDLIKA